MNRTDNDWKMKRNVLCISLTILLVLNSCARQQQRYTAPNGEFSYLPPADWNMRDYPGLKYQAAFGQSVNGFAPNINVQDIKTEESLDEFVKRENQLTPQLAKESGAKNFADLKQSKFTTDSQLVGHKTISQVEIDGRLLRIITYFFEGNDKRKFVITCTVPAEVGESYDQIFDGSIKTFKPGTS